MADLSRPRSVADRLGSVPTIPVLERIALALDAELIVALAPPRQGDTARAG